MLKTKVIASDVTNLTDARYFAAWGVDYISFNCMEGTEAWISADDLKEIKAWIEGPLFLGQFDGNLSVNEIEERVATLELDGVILGSMVPSDVQNAIDAEVLIRTLSYASVESAIDSFPCIIKTATSNNNAHYNHSEVYLDLEDIDLKSVTEIINSSSCGLVLKGGEEEKIGYKSFDFLDEVFELLID